MFDLPPDLDEYRSVEELQRLRLDLHDEMARLERDHDGLPFDDETRTKFTGAKEMIKRVDGRIAELRGRQQMLAEAAGDPRRHELGVAFRDVRAERPASDPFTPRHIVEGREAGLRAIDQHAGVLSAPAADRLDQHVRSNDPQGLDGRYLDAVGSPHYNSAFGKLLADPTTGHLRFTPAEVEAVRVVTAIEAQRNLNVTTGSAGQFAIPFALDPSIIMTGTGVINPIRDIARVETIGSTTWKGVASDGVVAAFGAELAPATDASPTLVQPTITTQKAFCFVPFSIEVGQDWLSLQSELLRLMNDSKNVLESAKMLLGTGTNEPGGILNIGGTGGLTTTQRVQTAVSATYAVGDPWLLKAAVPPRFVPATTYAAGPAIWDKTYRFVGGNSTEPLQMPTRGGDFLGAPKVEWSSFVVTTTTASRIMVAGDFRNGYRIVDRIGGTAELIPHLFGAAQGNLPTGQRGLYYYWRVGGGVVAPNAFRYLEVL